MVKICVVQFSNTSAQPNTVMVKAHDTIIAVMAVRRSQGPKDVTGFAKFHLVYESISGNLSISLRLKIKNFLIEIL